MAPYDYEWNNYNNQQQPNGSAYGFHEAVGSSHQYGSNPATSTYQSDSYQQTLPNPTELNRAWYQQPSRAATANENRAAETLSSLSTQEAAYNGQHNRDSQASNSTTINQPNTYSQATSNDSANSYQQTWNPTQQGSQASNQNPTIRGNIYNFTRPLYETAFRSYASRRPSNSHAPITSRPDIPGNNYGRDLVGRQPTNQASQGHQGPPSHTRVPSASSKQVIHPRRGSSTGRGSPGVNTVAMAANARVQSITPTAMQQQARNAPPPAQSTPHNQAPVTIDPSHVYDPWPEQQRQAERAAEERRKLGVEQAKKEAAEKEAAEKKAAEEAEAAREAREAEQAKEQTKGIEQAKRLSAKGSKASKAKPGPADTEAEMRAMFEKMRKFNQTDPDLLARLWEEERTNHLSSSPSAPPATKSVETNHTTTPKTKPSSNSAAKLTGSGKPRGRPPKDKTGDAAKAGGTVAQSNANQAPKPAQTTAPAEQPPSAPIQAQVQAAAASQPQPAASQSAQVWPPGRKQLLSETGARWINEHPKNKGKHVTATSLAELLHGNPSYPDLCKSIEEMGYHLDRTAFAKALLVAVPDLNKPSSTASPVVGSAPSAQAQPAVTSGPYATPVPPQSVPYVNMGNGYEGPTQAAMAPNTVIPPARKTPAIKPVPVPLVDAHGRPLPKSEAARKRTFQDLVDQTAGDDDSDQDAPPPPKAQHFSASTHFSGLQPQSIPNTMNSMVGATPAPPKLTKSSREAKLAGKVLVEGMKRENVARRSMYDPRTIARDILLATGRHPEMRPLNDHLMNMQHILADHSKGVENHKYDLSTVRWDLIDPGDPTSYSDEEGTEDGSQADDESDNVNIAMRPPPGAMMSNGDGTVTMTAAHAPTFGKIGFVPRKRGRKPGSSVPGVRSLAGSGTHTPTTQRQPVSRASADSSAATGYAAFREQNITYDENGNPVKKKGRPIGWRKAIHSREAQGLTPATGPKKVPDDQRQRRPRRPRETTDEPPPPEPHYNEYECQWEDCDAMLHNLDTLRKHIIKIHGFPDADNMWVCRWHRCGSDHDTFDAKGKSRASNLHEYSSINKWVNHIENAHIQPYARSLGDGPRSGLSDAYDSEASQAYLSDASGRIITPRATPLEDLTEENEAQSEVLAPVLRRGMPRVRGILSDDQKEDEHALATLEAKKLSLGPAFERTGARIVNERRRRGLYDDEDFEGDFSEDDGPP